MSTAAAENISMSSELEAKRAWYNNYISSSFTGAEQKANAQHFEDLATAGKTAKKLGDKAPAFELTDLTSNARISLTSLLSKGPLVLFFYRGAWCPFCNVQVRRYQRALQEFQSALKDQSKQVQVAGITLQVKEHVEKIKNDAGVTYPLLTDGAGAVTSAYGLLYKVPAAAAAMWKEKFGLDLVAVQQNPKSGDEAAKKAVNINTRETAVVDGVELVLPISGVYVIDTKGTIRFADVQTDYRNRADTKDIIDALKTL